MNYLASFYVATLRLEKLTRLGLDDTPEADDQRGSMDALWARMGDKERGMGREFSVEVFEAFEAVQGEVK